MSERISLFLKKLEKNQGNLLNRFSLAQAFFEEGQYEQAIPNSTLKVLKNVGHLIELEDPQLLLEAIG